MPEHVLLRFFPRHQSPCPLSARTLSHSQCQARRLLISGVSTNWTVACSHSRPPSGLGGSQSVQYHPPGVRRRTHKGQGWKPLSRLNPPCWATWPMKLKKRAEEGRAKYYGGTQSTISNNGPWLKARGGYFSVVELNSSSVLYVACHDPEWIARVTCAWIALLKCPFEHSLNHARSRAHVIYEQVCHR